jgi:hypothetical protein
MRMREATNPVEILIQFHEPHYQSIGRVAANWATFEALVNSALWRLAKVDDEPGACITSQIPNSARQLEALVALVRLRRGSHALIKKLTKFQQDTRGIQDQRNRIVHSPWHLDPKTGEIKRLEISARGALKFELVPMSREKIDKVVDLTKDHVDRFSNLVVEILAEVEKPQEVRP